MKKTLKNCIIVFLTSMFVLAFSGCSQGQSKVKKDPGALLARVRINNTELNSSNNLLGNYGDKPGNSTAGKFTQQVEAYEELNVAVTSISYTANKVGGTLFKIDNVAYAVGTITDTGNFSAAKPAKLSDGDFLWLKVNGQKVTQYYKIEVEITANPDGATLADTNALLSRITINGKSIAGDDLGISGSSPSGVVAGGNISLGGNEFANVTGIVANGVKGGGGISNIEYAVTANDTPPDAGAFSADVPKRLNNDAYLWLKVTSGTITRYYKIRIMVVPIEEGGTIKTTEGFGVSDPEFVEKYPYFVIQSLGKKEILTEAKLKDIPPSYWNTQATEAGLRGHKHAYPDPFHFANGNRVVNLKDWENRRKELQLLVSYYGKGHIPSINSDVVDIWLTGDTNTTINIRHKASKRTASFTITVTDNPALTVAGNEGKLYASCQGGSGNAAAFTLGTSNHASAVNRAALATLYGDDTSPGNITRDSATAWCAGVLLAAIEGTDDPVEDGGPKQKAKQYFYATSKVGTPNPGLPDQSWFTTKGPLYSTGYSTLGKQAAAHTMGIGRNGSRFGHADIGDSGAGGAAIERFNAVAGFRLDITVGEVLAYSGYTEDDVIALGLDPNLKNPVKDASNRAYGWPVPIAPKNHIGAITRSSLGSLGGPQDMWGAPYYTYGLQAGRSWPMGKGMPDIANTGKGNLRMVRGWAPYWETFDRVPNVNDSFDAEPTASTSTPSSNYVNAKVPYAPYKHTATESYGGIQQWMQARNENSTDWFGDVCRQFTDLHSGLTLDNSQEGFGCSLPFDTYFEIILNAPYGCTFIRAGVQQTRTNQPSMWANWLIIDEVYKMYGELEYAEEFNNGVLVEDPKYPGSGLKMGWDKYIWRNLNFFNWGSHGGNTAEETSTSATVRDLVRSGRATTQEAMSNVTLAKCRDPAFPVDDPVYYLSEYCKMDWGRPGSPTIAERVRRRVEPILKDYFMGEIYHEVPAPAQASNNTAALQAQRAATYHNAAKAAYTPTGPKFKRMDWRGLTDNPEWE